MTVNQDKSKACGLNCYNLTVNTSDSMKGQDETVLLHGNILLSNKGLILDGH